MRDVSGPRIADDAAAQQAELARRAQLVDELSQEPDDTNRGLIALHTELEAAWRAEARLAAIVASSDDAMISVGPSHLIRTWNPGAQRLFGHTEQHIVGRSIDTLMPEAAFRVFQSVVEQIRAEGHSDSYQSRWRRSDGTDVDVAVSVSPMRDAEGAPDPLLDGGPGHHPPAGRPGRVGRRQCRPRGDGRARPHRWRPARHGDPEGLRRRPRVAEHHRPHHPPRRRDADPRGHR
ncbi:PAS domain S-box protein [Streptomyces sp. YC419]|uniref:histidine kinase n=1 Tax=Streptomyces ureilyticus TaxID=1775131 RepID=A0ABX0E4L6_9ACTN|nr:PAS domain S-box protein [Streptomyces ureilyticus]